MAWFRVFEGISSDPKWPVVARRAGVDVGTVVAIWLAVLDHASQSEERGSLDGFDCETIDALYGYEDGVCQRVLDAMAGKNLIEDGKVVNWDKRQPNREDDGSAERKRRQREREKENMSRDVTQGHAPVTPMSRDVTQGHAPDKIREDKKREEYINTPPHPPSGGDSGKTAEVSSSFPAKEPEASLAEKPKRKREATGNSKAELTALIEHYTSSAPLRQTLEDFRAMRERMRKPLTGKALELILRDLDRLSPDSDGGKQAVLEQSIKNGWQGVFALKDNLPAPRDGPRSPSGGEVDFYGNPRPRATTQYQKMAQDREDIARICNQLWDEKERSENERQALSG